MKFTVDKNEAYLKMSINDDYSLSFMYGFNLEKPEDGYDPETPEGQALADCIATIAGLVFLSQHHVDEVIEVGEHAVETGEFNLGDENSASMAKFMESLTDEQIELFHTKPEGEA